MPLPLRRLLNYLPIPHGGRDAIYLKASWHKPAPFSQWPTQAPFQSRPTLRSDHFGRGLRRQRFIRSLVRWSFTFAFAWIVLESVRAVT